MSESPAHSTAPTPSTSAQEPASAEPEKPAFRYFRAPTSAQQPRGTYPPRSLQNVSLLIVWGHICSNIIAHGTTLSLPLLCYSYSFLPMNSRAPRFLLRCHHLRHPCSTSLPHRTNKRAPECPAKDDCVARGRGQEAQSTLATRAPPFVSLPTSNSSSISLAHRLDDHQCTLPGPHSAREDLSVHRQDQVRIRLRPQLPQRGREADQVCAM